MNDSAIHAVAGGLGGMIAMTLTYPLVVLSTRSAVSKKKASSSSSSDAKALSTYAALKKVLDEEGVEGLYAGLGSSLVGIAVTNTIFYFGLEQTRTILSTLREQRLLAVSTGEGATDVKATTGGSPIWETMAASSLAGAATTIATNPLWLVQTYQATRGSVADKGKSASSVRIHASITS